MWDSSLVLESLKSSLYESTQYARLKNVSLKTAALLLAITSAKKNGKNTCLGYKFALHAMEAG